MKKFLVAMAMTASLAAAKDMTGRLGVGSSTTLDGVSGLALQYQISKFLTLEPIVGLHIEDSTTAFSLGLSGFLNLADMENANLLVGVSLSLRNDGEQDNPMDLAVSLPIRPVVFFNDRISAHLSTGLNIDVMQAGDDPHENKTVIDLGGHLFGDAGMTFYF